MLKVKLYWRHAWDKRGGKLAGKLSGETQIITATDTNDIFTKKRKLERERNDGAVCERHEIIAEERPPLPEGWSRKLYRDEDDW